VIHFVPEVFGNGWAIVHRFWFSYFIRGLSELGFVDIQDDYTQTVGACGIKTSITT
jgi:hypothetical protein